MCGIFGSISEYPVKVSDIQKIHIINNDKRLKIIEENIIDND